MERTFAVSDLHGMYKLYEQICNFLAPDDIVYFLGDAGDRGPDSWKLIKAIAANPQWIYLCGNHEDMLADAILDYSKDSYLGSNFYTLKANGGYETFNSWLEDNTQTGWYRFFKELPLYETYTNSSGHNIILCHSGFSPKGRKEETIIPTAREALIWDRRHIASRHWSGASNSIIVHGHTPIMHIDFDATPGALWYCNNHKVGIDNGAFATGKTCLLDLDTFDEHIFEIPNFINL